MTAGDQHYSPYEPAGRAEPPAEPRTELRAEPPAAPEAVAWLLWPARVVAFVLVLPVRLVWNALRAAAQAVGSVLERILGLLGRALLAVLRPVVAVLLWPLRWIGRALLLPVVAAVGLVVAWLVERLMLPVLRGIAAVLRALWRSGPGAVLRALAQTIGWAWHATGRALAFVGRVLAWPFVALYRHVLTPIGHAVRGVWRVCVLAPWRAVRRTTAAGVASVRASVREARRQAADQVRRALGLRQPPR